MPPYKPFLKPRQSLPPDSVPAYFTNQRKQQLAGDGKKSLGAIRTISWNPLSSLLATGSADKTLRVWNPERPHIRFSTELKGHTSPIEKTAWSPNHDALLTSLSSDGTLKFWDARDRKCTSELSKALGDGFTLTWSPDGNDVVVGNKANAVYVIDTRNTNEAVAVTGNQQMGVDINDLCFSWSGEEVFAATGEGSVRILSFPGFENMLEYPYNRDIFDKAGATGLDRQEFVLKGHTSSCTAVELSPSGKYLASGGSDAVICLWDPETWLCKRTLLDTTSPIRSLSFTWDGCFIAAAGENHEGSGIAGGGSSAGGVDVYHCESGEKVFGIKAAGVGDSSGARCVAWAPSRYYLAWAESDKVNVWGGDPERK